MYRLVCVRVRVYNVSLFLLLFFVHFKNLPFLQFEEKIPLILTCIRRIGPIFCPIEQFLILLHLICTIWTFTVQFPTLYFGFFFLMRCDGPIEWLTCGHWANQAQNQTCSRKIAKKLNSLKRAIHVALVNFICIQHLCSIYTQTHTQTKHTDQPIGMHAMMMTTTSTFLSFQYQDYQILIHSHWEHCAHTDIIAKVADDMIQRHKLIINKKKMLG